jgi:hypothetical protein
MGVPYLKYYPGTATLDETCRACTDEVIRGEPKQLKKVEAVIHDKDDGTPEKLNEATFLPEDDPLAILTMLDDFVFVNIATPQGVSNAAAASNGRTNIGGPGAQFTIWVQEEEVPVQILGKHT